MMLLKMHLLRPLFMTLLIELGLAAFFGVRSRKGLIGVGLINCITNPLVNVILLCMRFYLPYVWSVRAIPLLEGIVVVGEAVLFRYCLENIRFPLLFSLGLNGASFFLGGWLLRLF